MVTTWSKTFNPEFAKFEENRKAVGEILMKSETGRLAIYYQNELFPTLKEKEIEAHEKAKAKIFSTENFKQLRDLHRPDLKEETTTILS